MSLSVEEIKKVAKLAKVSLTHEEIEVFSKQFNDILNVIDKLQGVDTSNVTPIHNPSQNKTIFREDIVNDGGMPETIVENAPKTAFNCFVVPKVVE